MLVPVFWATVSVLSQSGLEGSYVLDLATTGLDPANFADGVYTWEQTGDEGCRVEADAPWVFRWTPDAERPLPPPQSVIVAHHVRASATGDNGWALAFNGYEAQESSSQAESRAFEQIAMMNPGETLTLGTTNFPVALVEQAAGTCRLEVGYAVKPVTVHLEGAVWSEGQARPAILPGQLVQAELRPEAEYNGFAWEITGDAIGRWDIARTPPFVPGDERVVESARSPRWLWRAPETEVAKVSVSAGISFPTNRYVTSSPTVRAELEVNLVVPEVEIGPPSFRPVSTYIEPEGRASTLTEITLPRIDLGDDLEKFGEGELVFMHVATFPERLSTGETARFPFRLGRTGMDALVAPVLSDDGSTLNVGTIRVYEDHDYTTYALFQPVTPGSAPIPLKRFEWRAFPATDTQAESAGELRVQARPWQAVTELPFWIGDQSPTAFRFVSDETFPEPRPSETFPGMQARSDNPRLDANQLLYHRVRNLIAIGDYVRAFELREINREEVRWRSEDVALLFALGRIDEAITVQEELLPGSERQHQLLAIMQAHRAGTLPDYATLQERSPGFDLAAGAAQLVRQLGIESHFPLAEVVYNEFVRLNPDPDASREMAGWIREARAKNAELRRKLLPFMDQTASERT